MRIRAEVSILVRSKVGVVDRQALSLGEVRGQAATLELALEKVYAHNAENEPDKEAEDEDVADVRERVHKTQE